MQYQVCTHEWHTTAMALLQQMDPLILLPTNFIYHICTHSIGGRVVHSEGRLIPHHFPITEPQQINHLIRSGVTGYRVTCDVSSGPPSPWFNSPNGTLDSGGVSQRQYTHTTWLNVNTTNIDTFQNRDVYCDDMRTNYFYLYLTSSNNSE